MEKKTRNVTVSLPEDVAATLESWCESGRIASIGEYLSSRVRADTVGAQDWASETGTRPGIG
ncbi:hypothetical protein [Nocardia pseudobrasiliensis]|uniref:CopG family transcriptional regulator n=1 Tax=Nocardia pseudobrasiliensis TaxID=45979 RepID=A0A370IDF1_9NOCA|nr:hypothetical protein [Nocardia pseudobrasiliensis]RDI68630.1 hypothetical protein DFR76_101165 [Nocardia pseudobrasiliensis]